MPTRRRTPSKPAKRPSPGPRPRARVADPCAPFVRQVKRLQKEIAEERARHARQLAAVRRAADRRLAGMMQEIAALRHHQARAEALERLLAERETATVSPAGEDAS
ncbi:MAG: hypothetical protein U0807_08980 [Candidatus Binatia bacterium]